MSQSNSSKWVTRLRAACPKGWSVKDSRGSIRLSVRSGAGGANGVSKTLPLAWAADTVAEAVALITRLHDSVESGIDLADALDREFGSAPATQPSSAAQWPALVEKFRADLMALSQIKDVTWERGYKPYLDRAVELLEGTNAPVNAKGLVTAVVKTWPDKPGERKKAVESLRKFLDFCVEDHHIPAASWTLTDRSAKQLRGPAAKRREVACPSDPEILRLMDSLPESDAGQRWWNAIALMALYGLRPAEVNSVMVREHPNTGEPALYCPRVKVNKKGQTKPRWLMPLPLTTRSGDQVEWNLVGAMSIGQLPLPDMVGNKYALRTFLDRQAVWVELKKQYAESGEWLRGYSFRNAYSLRGHRAGRRPEPMSVAMGHSLATHIDSYEWCKAEDVLEHI